MIMKNVKEVENRNSLICMDKLLFGITNAEIMTKIIIQILYFRKEYYNNVNATYQYFCFVFIIILKFYFECRIDF